MNRENFQYSILIIVIILVCYCLCSSKNLTEGVDIKEGLSKGKIVGIIVGSIVGVIMLIFLFFGWGYWWLDKRKPSQGTPIIIDIL